MHQGRVTGSGAADKDITLPGMDDDRMSNTNGLGQLGMKCARMRGVNGWACRLQDEAKITIFKGRGMGIKG